MKNTRRISAKALAFSASTLALVIAGPLSAQDEQAEQETTQEEQADVTQDGADPAPAPTQGGITVTGSRIVRDTYTSISPLQVLNTRDENAAGLFDPSQILQRSEAASGTQIDATFQGFVLDNGPNSQTLNLRGLGAERTLLLLNGRRLGPSGVEGAPTSPSLNLLPVTLIDRYDLLLDGASSVYGSDAVAGVGNVILRKDYDGLEIRARGDINPMGSGEDYTIGAAWGFNTDRAFFGIGAEYDYRDSIRLRDRDFFRGCNTHYEIDQDGNVLTIDKADNAAVLDDSAGLISVSESECKIGGISGRTFITNSRIGSVYYKPGQGNIPGLDDYADSTNVVGSPLDLNGDGVRDVDFRDVNTNGADQDIVFLSEQKLINVMAYGEYTFPGDGNITPYFEANYSRAESFVDNNGSAQLFPTVPDLNQFNPCNFATGSGVDCRAADNALQTATGVTFGGGLNPLTTGFSLPVVPITTIQGDRDNIDQTQELYRAVIGVRGDIPGIGSSWSFDVSGVYSRSEGSTTRLGIREDRLALAMGLDPTADYDGDGVVDNNGDGIADDYDPNVEVFGLFGDPLWIGECNSAGLANPGLAAPDLLDGCVPVNLFADSVLGAPVGTFSSQAETDYLIGSRNFNTTYEQLIFSAYATGDLFDLQGGPAAMVIGAEYRRDEIASSPDFVASNGLFVSSSSDRGAFGSKRIVEVFGEVDLPLLAGHTLVEELTVNLSGRMTDEEFYGTNFTYSLKGGWRPIDQLLFKFSYGTSFRAPNLRENFLAGQSGFNTIFDPCAVPDDAFTAANGYDASLDDREETTLANCRAEGRDPTRVGIDSEGLNTFQSPSIEITTGGTLDIEPETSTSITTGFAFEETFGDGWDVALNVNYYDISLKDSIIEPNTQFIINDCFNRDDGQRGVFCDRISYDTDASTRLLISDVNRGFINLNEENVRGMDFNANFGKEVALFGELVDFGISIRANHLIERSTLFINDDGSESFDDDAGEFSLPKWSGRATFTADVGNFGFLWQVDYTGRVEQDAIGIDPLDDAFGTLGTGFFGDTCTGNGSDVVAGDGIFCRDVGFAEEQFLHNASISYEVAGQYEILIGVSNIFDTPPPLVDSNEVFAIANTAIGNGYNYDGRQFFGQIRYQF